MADLRAAWARLADGLWFVPGSIVLVAILLAIGMVELSTVVDPQALARWPRVFGASADGARSMLAAIAGSMITVAGVTFSITMVAVTQASSQYTPRILRNFMRDRANQIVLGIFVGVFAYCLVVLRTIRGGDGLTFVPSLAVLLGVLLAILGIAVLIFFVHHIATTLQASEIIARIARETVEVVDRLFPEELGEEAARTERAALLAAVPADRWRDVLARSTGYIQRVDGKGLMRVAREGGLVIRLEREIGEFVIAGLPVASLAPHPDSPPAAGHEGERPAEEAVASRFTISRYRTIDQDALFGVRQLVDIALKALSPGINDMTTASTCVDYLGAILVRTASRRVDSPYRSDDGVLRVAAAGPTFESLVQTAFDEVRQHAAGNVSVLVRQLETLEIVGRITRSTTRREVLLEQIALIEETGNRTVASAHDRERLDGLAARARGAIRLEKESDPGPR